MYPPPLDPRPVELPTNQNPKDQKTCWETKPRMNSRSEEMVMTQLTRTPRSTTRTAWQGHAREWTAIVTLSLALNEALSALRRAKADESIDIARTDSLISRVERLLDLRKTLH